jgi:hypothetical protein
MWYTGWYKFSSCFSAAPVFFFFLYLIFMQTINKNIPLEKFNFQEVYHMYELPFPNVSFLPWATNPTSGSTAQR